MSSLAQRMRDAADTLEEASTMYGYRHPCEAGWSADELRSEARHVESSTPDYTGCSGACANLGDDE